MSDKKLDQLLPLERLINRTYSSTDAAWGPTIEPFTVTRICGFELFNTRPHHNYEDWSCGYFAKDIYGNHASREDLDDCLTELCRLRQAQKDEEKA